MKTHTKQFTDWIASSFLMVNLIRQFTSYIFILSHVLTCLLPNIDWCYNHNLHRLVVVACCTKRDANDERTVHADVSVLDTVARTW